MIKDANIYKRAEKHVQDHDLNNANFWLYNLEENLHKHSHG